MKIYLSGDLPQCLHDEDAAPEAAKSGSPPGFTEICARRILQIVLPHVCSDHRLAGEAREML